ncbi:TOMM precursor leader peptide-binding protein [Ruegeria meonggei]|uniref:YcaO-like family protein n=1 Tax=Ruegeria meonggei TaxID=1446476 RepID=A0A1X6ZLS6_9RHOB|nr:TOMM precursor leader peptide-binding protein [Ruegeria meonggei]SLN54969.1 YcaO-like family protein [Ruegeria meonggei]
MDIAAGRKNNPSPETERNSVLRIRSHLSFHQTAPGQILVVSENKTRVLNGRIFSDLLPKIDGRASIREIVGSLSDQHTTERVLFAIRQLHDQGITDDTIGLLEPQIAGFWDRAEINAISVNAALRQKVGILLLGSLEPEVGRIVVNAMRDKGIAADLVSNFGEHDLTLVLTDCYLRPELDLLHAEALRRSTPWMLAKPTGSEVWIGPLFDGSCQSCWDCLAQSLRDNGREKLAARAGSEFKLPGVVNAWIGDTQQSGRLIATQTVLAMASDGNRKLADQVLTFDAVTLEAGNHPVRARRNCRTCGEPRKNTEDHQRSNALDAAYIELVSRPRSLFAEGGHRICSPDDTYQRLSRLISPISGIIPAEPESVERGGYHVAKCRQVTPWREDSTALNFDVSLGAGGKGPTPRQASTGCLAEAVERYSGTFRGDELFIQASFDDLTEQAIHPDVIQQYSQAQYANRDANAKKAPFWIPEPFDVAKDTKWTGVWSLTNQRAALLPTAVCYYDVPVTGQDFCLADSNGCAAGNVLEEAILHGLLELIERDALAIWWYNRVRRPAFDLSRVSDVVGAQIDTLAAHLRSEGRNLSFIDLTNDLRIPVVGAVAWDAETGGAVTFGFGAHLDASIAASRAASELVQLDVYCSEAANSRLALRISHVKKWFETATITGHPYLTPAENAVPAPSPAMGGGRELKADVEALVSHLARYEIEVLAVDLTRADVGFPVARVFAPGLRHYHNRFAPGRLFDVPVTLGWQDQPTEERDLNPVVYFA